MAHIELKVELPRRRVRAVLLAAALAKRLRSRWLAQLIMVHGPDFVVRGTRVGPPSAPTWKS